MTSPAAQAPTTFAPGTFSPAPKQAPIQRILASQSRIEALLFLRHGEQLLLSFFIPVAMLFAMHWLPLLAEEERMALGFPVMLAMAAMSSGFTGQAISLAFDRRYGALERTGASGVPAWAIVFGKEIGVVVVSAIQVLVLSTVAWLLGWQPANFGAFILGVLVFFCGVAAFASLGLLMGGTLSSEIVLGLANLLWFLLIGCASWVVFGLSGDPHFVLLCIPSVALAQGLVTAFAGSFPLIEIAILLVWLGVCSFAAFRFFKFSAA
ncbi:MAG: ABC transporter permease [Corynebacterium sp.]|nr:ABC transporter permease [Corynebacterium sp.]